jgi:hypothetical protein
MKIYFVVVIFQLGFHYAAIDDLSSLLAKDKENVGLYKLRAGCYEMMGFDEFALRDLRAALKIQKCSTVELKLKEVEATINKSNDDYKILGVTKSTPMNEIKQIFFSYLILEHPDKHATSPYASEKILREFQFMKKNMAYQRIRKSRKTIFGKLIYFFNVMKQKIFGFTNKINV